MRLAAVLLCALSLVYAQARRDIRMATIGGRSVAYEVRDGYAVASGDIILGTIAEVEAAARGEDGGKLERQSVAYIGTSAPLLWPDGTMYYVIDASVPNQQRIRNAIDHWNTFTPLRVLPAAGSPNFVRFSRSTDGSCSSFLGMRGGQQSIQTGDGCTAGSMIHEIGHAFGLMHEQARNDRNTWLTVLYQNMDRTAQSNFDQVIPGSADFGYYDYDSIMHYSASGFTLAGADTLETVPAGIPIGQRATLSAGDIDGVVRLYGHNPESTTITTIPEGLPIVVDGVHATSPQSYPWPPGSQHTIAVDGTLGIDPRYTFVRWSDGGALSHTITAGPGTTVFAATFQRWRRLTASVSAGRGTVIVRPASPDGYYPERTEVLLTAQPAPGFHFAGWTGSSVQGRGYGPGSPAVLVEVLQQNAGYFAAFAETPPWVVDSQPRGRQVTIDGRSYFTPANFSWAAGSTHTISVPPSQFNASGTSRYQFTGWDSASPENGTIVAGRDPVTYKAIFRVQHELSLLISGAAQVTASPDSADDFYDEGTIVQLRAVPIGRQTIQSWSIDARGGGDTQAIVMDRPRVVGLTVGSALPFRVLNAGSYAASGLFNSGASAVAPLEIVTLFGSDLGPPSLVSGVLDSSGRLASKAGDTRILFDGTPAPVLYAWQSQTSAVVPSSVAGKRTVAIAVERHGALQSGSTVQVSGTVPGLFTADAAGAGQVAAVNEDGSINSPERPARAGSVIALYATGGGLLDRSAADGEIMGANLARPAAPVYVRIGKEPTDVLYAGSAPFFVNGALQVNIRIPDRVLPGSIPVQLVIGTFASPPGTTIAIQ
jgi:uncharacterized protein (TIGR03437 family)